MIHSEVFLDNNTMTTQSLPADWNTNDIKEFLQAIGDSAERGSSNICRTDQWVMNFGWDDKKFRQWAAVVCKKAIEKIDDLETEVKLLFELGLEDFSTVFGDFGNEEDEILNDPN